VNSELDTTRFRYLAQQFDDNGFISHTCHGNSLNMLAKKIQLKQDLFEFFYFFLLHLHQNIRN